MWKGLGSARLGLQGTVQRADWDMLCDNRNPDTGAVLTPRQKSNRRVGYDFNFHAPKSVSLLYGITQDQRILDVFREAVNATMSDMESEMKTRVRADGKNEDRTTGNMVWGEFIHFTARPVDGVPDPHLHSHCFVFNNTWDGEEHRWKAGQFADLKADAPYFEAEFHSRLARGFQEIGLPVERTKKGWEISGIERSTLAKFSRRTALIEAQAKERNITDVNTKSELGAKTRERKRKDLSLPELRDYWKTRLTPEERDALANIEKGIGKIKIAEDKEKAAKTFDLAIDHCFERNSVVPERTLLTEALKRSIGTGSLATVNKEFKTKGLLTATRKGQRFVTTPTVLQEERHMIEFARDGRGMCARLGNPGYHIQRDWLNNDQRNAVRHIWESHDRVILVRGAAGVGKTTMMHEAIEGIEANGKTVLPLAPSADASRGVLREEEGFASADTVARFLLDERMQEQAKEQVLWIDEAGLLGTRTMNELFQLAEKLDARVILSGDRRQHGSVERGAALRLLETEAGVLPAEIREIQRQKGDYKEAVKALSEGKTKLGFDQLNKLGWIHEVDSAARYKALADDYVSTINHGKTALVISPTHLEGEWITNEIRAQLTVGNRLGKEARQFLRLENSNLAKADRCDIANCLPDDVLVFHQNTKSFGRGDRVAVGSMPFPSDDAARFQVFHKKDISIAPGEIIRITRNGSTSDGKHRLNNGALYTVKRFDSGGNIVLSNGWNIAKDYGHLTYGYVVTSHASQGKTVQHVIIGQSSHSLPAASREQFYVSVSRGKEKATIYTDDKDALLQGVKQSNDRLAASDVFENKQRRQRAITLCRLEEMMPRFGIAREDKEIGYVRQ